jgi:hypothetical protein
MGLGLLIVFKIAGFLTRYRGLNTSLHLESHSAGTKNGNTIGRPPRIFDLGEVLRLTEPAIWRQPPMAPWVK